MNAADVRRVVDDELARGESFDNWHGIDRDNLSEHLVEPYEVLVEPLDPHAPQKPMWVVLHEHRSGEGYAIAFDAESGTWVLVDGDGSSFEEIKVADSLAVALTAM